ncbi:MAG TPA: threonine--tRNA ligase [Candidatus Limiplasma sp.]|nr:threonine--tRNA ligase [Candidatus Limiplasma sp.]HRX08466.1 threonine--tRNA ligase [Candidatus Limiplasma sp.]
MKLTVFGKAYEVEKGSSAGDLLRAEYAEDFKSFYAVKHQDGSMTDLFAPIEADTQITPVTFADEDGKKVFRHSCSHLMAMAVLELYPDAKLAIGPAIENGFYYDFDIDPPIKVDDLPAIEKAMDKIMRQSLRPKRFTLPRGEAIDLMKEKNAPYKVELIEDLPEDATLSFYQMGDFVDLCAGPHLPNLNYIKAFKLTHTAGAYWRGDEHKKMLCRIYGTCFPTKAELSEYLVMLEEAKKRDHRKLGRELDLFDLRDEGPGFPFFYPKGMVLRNVLEDYWRKIHRKCGYEEIKTPMMLNRDLWERSGHWGHYNDNMYTTKIDDMDFAIKPMNCPGGMLTYQRRLWSYRDLPLRTGELGLVHRHEKSGALHGLMRVRCFTQDDAHIYMTPDQIKDEIKGVYNLIDEVYTLFGFPYKVELSTRPENSIGSDEMWELATAGLQGALDDLGVPYTINEGDGAFYGPKIDFHLRDCIGRTWQCGTIQLDMNLPERFDLTYTGPDGEKHRPVMIHRVVYGSLERFIGILTEQYGGAFPTWLAPVQVKILTITNRSDDAAKALQQMLFDQDLRCELDLRNEKIGFKIREAQMQKIPYMFVLGDREAETQTVTIRNRKGDNLGTIPFREAVAMIQKLNDEKTID